MRKVPPGSHRRLHRVNQGHPQTWIFGEWQCVPFGAVNLPPTAADLLVLDVVSTRVIEDIRAQ